MIVASRIHSQPSWTDSNIPYRYQIDLFIVWAIDSKNISPASVSLTFATAISRYAICVEGDTTSLYPARLALHPQQGLAIIYHEVVFVTVTKWFTNGVSSFDKGDKHLCFADVPDCRCLRHDTLPLSYTRVCPIIADTSSPFQEPLYGNRATKSSTAAATTGNAASASGSSSAGIISSILASSGFISSKACWACSSVTKYLVCTIQP